MSRRGISLNELLVSISLIAVVLPLCGKLLWTLGQGQRAQVRAIERNREWMRLALQLKADALLADHATGAPQPQFHRRQGEIVEYSPMPQGLTRTIYREGERQHSDAFHLGRETELSFNSDPSSGKVTASISNKAAQADETETVRLVLPVAIERTDAEP